MGVFEALYLGIVQGLTEFLPVSSSGHLEIFSHIFGVKSEENLTFAITVHGGTVLSTIVIFRHELLKLITGFFKFKKNEEQDYIFKILVSLIPIVLIGLTLKDKIEALFGGSLLIVGCALLITAALLFFTYKAKPKTGGITYKDAFIIGIAQAFAVLPGLSRSGSTISTGLLLGVKREEVSKFSFLMVLIPIIGMNLLDIVKGEFSESTIGALPLIVGFLSSFIAGLFACKAMIKLVNSGKFIWFAVYCAVAGLAVISYSLFI
ncbi:MAG: undecaprenyl-diphosphate phosphatase [Rikenellaceae bacterium]